MTRQAIGITLIAMNSDKGEGFLHKNVSRNAHHLLFIFLPELLLPARVSGSISAARTRSRSHLRPNTNHSVKIALLARYIALMCRSLPAASRANIDGHIYTDNITVSGAAGWDEKGFKGISRRATSETEDGGATPKTNRSRWAAAGGDMR